MKRLRDELPGYDVTRRMERGAERGHLRMLVLVRPGEAMRWLHFDAIPIEVSLPHRTGMDGRARRQHRTPRLAREPVLCVEQCRRSGRGVLGLRRPHRNAQLGNRGTRLRCRDRDLRFELARPDAFRAGVHRPPWHAGLRLARDSGSVCEVRLHAAPARRRRREHHADRDRRGAPEPQARPRTSTRPRSGTTTAGSPTRRGRTSTPPSTCELHRRRFRATSTTGDTWDGRCTRVRWGHNMLLTSGMAGGITGEAPLFERFTLGDSSTLRGWDKYDIAPAGGDRVGHLSVEYRQSRLRPVPRQRIGLDQRRRGPRTDLDRLWLPSRELVRDARLPAEHSGRPHDLHDRCPLLNRLVTWSAVALVLAGLLSVDAAPFAFALDQQTRRPGLRAHGGRGVHHRDCARSTEGRYAPCVSSSTCALASEQAGPYVAQAQPRFGVSYDLWEERFAVTRTDTTEIALARHGT